MHPLPRAALAGGLVAAAVVLTPGTAEASTTVAVKRRTLVVTGDSASDKLALRARGGTGNDDMFVGLGDDFLRGDDGNDDLFGGPGADDLDGGAGTDNEFP